MEKSRLGDSFFFFGQLPPSSPSKKRKKKNFFLFLFSLPPLVLGLASGGQVRHEVLLCQGLCRHGRGRGRAPSRDVERKRSGVCRRQMTTTTTKRKSSSSSNRVCPPCCSSPRRRRRRRRRQQHRRAAVGAPPTGRGERVHRRGQRHFESTSSFFLVFFFRERERVSLIDVICFFSIFDFSFKKRHPFSRAVLALSELFSRPATSEERRF